MGALILLYFAIGMLYCVSVFYYLTTSRLDEFKNALNSANSKRMKHRVIILSMIIVVLFWPKFLIENII